MFDPLEVMAFGLWRARVFFGPYKYRVCSFPIRVSDKLEGKHRQATVISSLFTLSMISCEGKRSTGCRKAPGRGKRSNQEVSLLACFCFFLWRVEGGRVGEEGDALTGSTEVAIEVEGAFESHVG